MSVREAGLRGGAARKAQLGAEGYSKLGQAAGAATLARHGKEHYARIGKLGRAALNRAIEKQSG